jgi:outer membrane protein OmpA-like peptidoglycan-associated protein
MMSSHLSASSAARPTWPALLIAFSVSVLFISPRAFAQLKDVAGSKDHAAIKRYEGSAILGYDFKKFDEYVVLLGPVKEGRISTDLSPTKGQKVEGQVTRILYVAPESRSPLEVLRNYEQELTKSGFNVLYTCAGKECGTRDAWLGQYYLYEGERKLHNYPPKGGGGPPGQVTEYAFTGAKDQRLMTAKRPAPQGDSYVSVFVATGTSGSHKETNGRTLTLLEVVDTVPMETKMVTVEADAMAKDIAATGHVALYGIYFDHDKADLKPESAPTIAEIAKLLKQDPKLTMYVVGHTDNVGGYEYNMGLSERRAAAVVKELTGKHGIQAARLKAAGAGPLAPVAPNDSDPGRAKNRRVELVKQ